MTQTLRNLLLLVVLGLSLAVPAFADDGQVVSTLLGAGLGGWAGSAIGHGDGRLAVTGAGVLIGGVIGNELGRPSYRADYSSHPNIYNAYPYDMFPTPSYATYQPNYVAPPSPPPQPVTYIDEDYGSYCRQYSETIRIGNHVHESYGTACLQPDGSWHVVQ